MKPEISLKKIDHFKQFVIDLAVKILIQEGYKVVKE